MIAALAGQLLGIAFASGLNLYVTIAALGLLSRFGIIDGLPEGLKGLESMIVIGSALALYLVEAVVDKIRHADSLWDTVHTFIRPPAAALLAIGVLWVAPVQYRIAGAAFAFLVALAAHGTKAGLRVALNTGRRPRSSAWISLAEDIAAIAFAVTAIQYPEAALAAGGIVLLITLVLGPRLWRAFVLGLRCLVAWVRSLFGPSRWRDADEIPPRIRALIGEQPLGSAPPRGARAGVTGIPGVGAFRTGWLVLTPGGPLFLYRTAFGFRGAALPTPLDFSIDRGVWADCVRAADDNGGYTLYLLKDGPAIELAVSDLQAVSSVGRVSGNAPSRAQT